MLEDLSGVPSADRRAVTIRRPVLLNADGPRGSPRAVEVETVGIEPTPVCLQGRLAGPRHVRPRQYSRQESNLPRPLCKRGASAARATGVSASHAGNEQTTDARDGSPCAAVSFARGGRLPRRVAAPV